MYERYERGLYCVVLLCILDGCGGGGSEVVQAKAAAAAAAAQTKAAQKYDGLPLSITLQAAEKSVLVARRDQSVRWHESLDSALAAAKKSARPVYVHGWFVGCGSCVVLERDVLSSPAVAQWLNANTEPCRLNIAEDRRLRATSAPHERLIHPANTCNVILPTSFDPATYLATLQKWHAYLTSRN